MADSVEVSIIDKLTNTAAVTALLATSTSIYMGPLIGDVSFPCVQIRGAGGEVHHSFGGELGTDRVFQLDVYASDPVGGYDIAREVKKALTGRFGDGVVGGKPANGFGIDQPVETWDDDPRATRLTFSMRFLYGEDV